MFKEAYGAVPILTTNAGACLTAANWQEVNVHRASYYLDFLLLRPGYHVLKKIPNIKKYLGWSGTFILNGMNLKANRAGEYALISPYDGSKIKLTASELVELIQILQPDAVILPRDIMTNHPAMWLNWKETIFPYVAEDELRQHPVPKAHGVYYNITGFETIEDITRLANEWIELPHYYTGEVNRDVLKELCGKKIGLIESDVPAKSAIEGQLINSHGPIDLTDPVNEQIFDVIDNTCHCPTCFQEFTKAYLYHLYQHTPLLCHRFLIQHNMAYFMGDDRI